MYKRQVYTDRPKLAKIARAVRDWGRDCWCGYDNPVNGKCGIRFEREVPGIPGFYDHRYYYCLLYTSRCV